MIPYKYAILRYRHNISHGEFVNVGLLMQTLDDREIFFKKTNRYSRLSRFFGDQFDGPGYRRIVEDIQRRTSRLSQEIQKRQQKLPFDEPNINLKFDAITERIVPRNSVHFDWSKIMGGVVPDPHVRFERLFEEFITVSSEPTRQRRDEEHKNGVNEK